MEVCSKEQHPAEEVVKVMTGTAAMTIVGLNTGYMKGDGQSKLENDWKFNFEVILRRP